MGSLLRLRLWALSERHMYIYASHRHIYLYAWNLFSFSHTKYFNVHKNFMYTGSVVSILALYPLDTARTILQVSLSLSLFLSLVCPDCCSGLQWVAVCQFCRYTHCSSFRWRCAHLIFNMVLWYRYHLQVSFFSLSFLRALVIAVWCSAL